MSSATITTEPKHHTQEAPSAIAAEAEAEAAPSKENEAPETSSSTTPTKSPSTASGNTAAAGTSTPSSSSASATGASNNLGPGRQISIQTNRNRNTSSRQKSWKVHNTNSISKLQTDYIKYYKSKGCQTVKFYFRNAAINNMTQSFRDLGVHEGAMLFAMENGKPYS